MRRQDAEAMSDPLRQVALHRDIKLLQAANECYCCVPSLFKFASPPPHSFHVPSPLKWDITGWKSTDNHASLLMFDLAVVNVWQDNSLCLEPPGGFGDTSASEMVDCENRQLSGFSYQYPYRLCGFKISIKQIHLSVCRFLCHFIRVTFKIPLWIAVDQACSYFGLSVGKWSILISAWSKTRTLY